MLIRFLLIFFSFCFLSSQEKKQPHFQSKTLPPPCSFPILYPRPTSPNYICGDSFRNWADFAFDELRSPLNPLDVKHGDTIFVQANYLDRFFQNIHPLILHPYILITHNDDADIPGIYRDFLDNDKIIAWFGENYDGYPHPKIHIIPMGMANSNWPNGKPKLMDSTISLKIQKKHLLHLAFTYQTNSNERLPLLHHFSKIPFCYCPPAKGLPKYWIDVASSKFELCPRGIALDTYRLWECLYLGTIPIVKSSSLDPLLKDLPVLIVEDWSLITEQFLNEKFLEFQKKSFNMDKLKFSYWKKMINSYKPK